MNSLALRTLRTVSRSSTVAPATTLLRGSLLKSGVFRSLNTQSGGGESNAQQLEELPENLQELKELIQKMKTTATEKEAQAKETHVRLMEWGASLSLMNSLGL